MENFDCETTFYRSRMSFQGLTVDKNGQPYGVAPTTSYKHDQNFKALREAIGLLAGEMAGIIIGADSPELLDRVESLRITAQSARDKAFYGIENKEEPDKELIGQLEDLSNGEIKKVTDAYTLYFRLANLAEKWFHGDSSREGTLTSTEKTTVGIPIGFGEAIRNLAKQGKTYQEVRDVLDNLSIGSTLTAHPNEGRTPEIKRLLIKIEECFSDLRYQSNQVFALTDKIQQVREPLKNILREVREGKIENARGEIDKLDIDPKFKEIFELTSQLYAASPIRSEKPTVEEEAAVCRERLVEMALDVVPNVLAKIEDDLTETFETEKIEEVPSILKIGSWVAGDRDGNPKVGMTQTLFAIKENCGAIVAGYIEKLKKLEVEDRSKEDLQKIIQKLINTYFAIDRDENLTSFNKDGYNRPRKLLDDLKNIAAKDDRKLKILRYSIKSAGFHLAPLDIRQSSKRNESCLNAILNGENYSKLCEADKVTLLNKLLKDSRSIDPRALERLAEPAKSAFESFKAIAEAHKRYDEKVIQRVIISHAETESDMLEAVLLAKLAGAIESQSDGEYLSGTINFVPLFETGDSLKKSPNTIKSLCNDGSIYRKYLTQNSLDQEVMVGYSDSSKDVGAFTAATLLAATKTELTSVAKSIGIDLSFFHGWGPNDGRGNGKPIEAALLAQPQGTVGLKVDRTVQGEDVSDSFGLTIQARQELEKAITVVLQLNLEEEAKKEELIDIWERAQASSTREYHQLVDSKEFSELFLKRVTPQSLEWNSGSRPAQRPTEDLAINTKSEQPRDIARAIDWNRNLLLIGFYPGWYGSGAALVEFSDQDLKKLSQDRAFKRQMNLLEKTLIKQGRELRHLKTIADHVAGDQEAASLLNKVLNNYKLTREQVLRYKKIDKETETLVAKKNEILRPNDIAKEISQRRDPYLRVLRYALAVTNARLAREKGSRPLDEAKINTLKDNLARISVGLTAAIGSAG